MIAGRKVLKTYPPCRTCGFIETIEVVQAGAWKSDAEYDADEAAWRRHLRHTTDELLISVPIDELRRRYDVDKIRRQHGQWAVTTYGLECLTDNYAIEKSRVFEQDWVRHMAEKTWVLIDDFTAALDSARRLFRPGLSPRLRFSVLKRDGYRCQLCGTSAADGSRLQVDHKTARAKGGTNEIANLWTLCWECNIGKATDDL